ncbi:hypothetical protein [Rhodopirellula sp. MGV]|uniref:hypothetical protein n=1 Tax=Rhodopirellula sp. MGV TaxID=2023130 RepID=UPI000B95F602|nr:hypothetical protein [Rhodopirellula sp. MGV]OYP31686.1 hypothetical protein CGZ80_20530 [Rhodopirellula sp. MGV]PNY33987.1 hypothetical protein C2E31_25475 [Rhodopirellula baltica]
MKLQFKQYIVASVALAAGLSLATITSTSHADEAFIVKAEVVSDTVAAPAVAPTNYVGDIVYEGEAVGSCPACENGTCADGSCLSKLGLGRRNQEIGCQPRQYDRPDLFYNFYSQGNCNAANAQMYVSPLPVPQFVGNTYFTYQPFYPHEMMYKHKDRYHNFYDNGRGLNRTKVKYSYPPVRTAIENVYWNKLRLPR